MLKTKKDVYEQVFYLCFVVLTLSTCHLCMHLLTLCMNFAAARAMLPNFLDDELGREPPHGGDPDNQERGGGVSN